MTFPTREDLQEEPLKVTLQLNVWPAVVTFAILAGALVGLLLWAWWG